MTKPWAAAIMQLMRRFGPVAAGLLLAACVGVSRSAIVVPRPVIWSPAAPDAAIEWAKSTVPAEPREIRFNWRFQDDENAVAGRGRVRLAVPDSARLDIEGPLGFGGAAAFVLGDSAVWIRSKEDLERLVPSYPLFWAMVGIVRPPGPADSVKSSTDGTLSAWRYHHGADTLDFMRLSGPPVRLVVEARGADGRIGTVETFFSADGLPSSSRLHVPARGGRLELSISSNVRVKSFASDIWIPES